MGKKWVYYFGEDGTEGNASMRDLLGGKGANLAEMASLGIPVPPGFTVSTEACLEFFRLDRKFPDGMWDEVLANLRRVEEALNARFGDERDPLLVSIRSGARVSMPGMMDTVLNVGLNEKTLAGLIKKTGNERFAYDAYRRFITMFGDVVMGVDRLLFEKELDRLKEKKGVEADVDLDASDLKSLIGPYKEIFSKGTGRSFPDDPLEQLRLGVQAVFSSWFVPRAVTYRKLHRLPDTWGTAVNVQAMVFGNMGETSGTGVAFTRDPATGERIFFGEALLNAQGEDVVAGIRTPMPIDQLKDVFPDCYDQLLEIREKLERHYRDMQDMEFTIQEGKLYMLQTRAGKRTATAAVNIAVDMVDEGLIDKETAIMRMEPGQIDQLLHPMVDPASGVNVIAKGLAASPGASVGKVVFTAEDAEKQAAEGERVILVRAETSPEDIGGMHAAQGILTSRGGTTSHAAVVARGMGKSCIVGCNDIRINEKKKEFTAGEITVKEGDVITINGSAGEVILGKVKLVQPEVSGSFSKIMDWADRVRTLKVRTNADTPHDAKVAVDLGAEGIGLCRTEHMFFEGERIAAVREMILSDNPEERRKPLERIKPMQKGDFKEIFKVMDGLPVTIRLLDPPLHEFLPQAEHEIRELAEDMGISYDKLMSKVESLKEFNPMLGHRGCRLGITYPEIYEMQARAIFEAACELVKEGYKVIPEVMIPLVGEATELAITREMTEKVAEETVREYGVTLEYSIGTMIELPRAAITADKIAQEADFFSFGTNDLTQMVFGLSRDDAAKFLPHYLERGIFADDPFMTLDRDGVGSLMIMAVEKGKETKKDLKIGICGEHGGDPRSVEFCHEMGLDYVSCSPYRVPVARLSAAHAGIKEKAQRGEKKDWMTKDI